ncbi:hypothetical protein CA3LBN_002130 [Candidozyma haemuli]|uniref:Uncharacterized protein n=1 Tax=Candidozyma haemuli TaxID=45357 RepID=A0ABX8I5E4_9ASCO|nr:hypothetical protein CA3LBN_002130 [[Candida] haemuloni]
MKQGSCCFSDSIKVRSQLFGRIIL